MLWEHIGQGPYPSLGRRWPGEDSTGSGAWEAGDDQKLAWELVGGRDRKSKGMFLAVISFCQGLAGRKSIASLEKCKEFDTAGAPRLENIKQVTKGI